MMGRNIEQVYLTNPITSNQSLDLMYFGRSPYGTTNDAVMTFANFQAQFAASGLAGQVAFYATSGSTLSGANLVAGSGISISLVGNTFTFSTLGAGPVTSITGTANQVLANGAVGIPESGAVTLTLPQNIDLHAALQVNTVQFNSNNGLLDSAGLEMLSFNPAASAVNHFKISNAAIGTTPLISVVGTDPDIAINFQSKGLYGFAFFDGSANISFSGGPSSGSPCVNSIVVFSAVTATSPFFESEGTDANIGMNFAAKGNGGFNFIDGLGAIAFSVAPGAGTNVNYISVDSNSTGNPPYIFAGGSDANVNMDIFLQASGVLRILSSTLANNFTFTPAATLSAPKLAATGTDSNIGLILAAKGTGVITLSTVALTQPLTILSGTTSQHTTNFAFTNAATTQTITFLDTNQTVTATSAALTNGQLAIGNTGNLPTAATITAGAGITVTNGAGSITITSTTSGMTWSTVTGSVNPVAIDTGYVSNSAGLLTFTLPTTFAVGDEIAVEGLGAGGWKVTAGAATTIKLGSQTTSSAGSLASVAASDNIYITGIVANTTWRVRSTNSAGLTIS